MNGLCLRIERLTREDSGKYETLRYVEHIYRYVYCNFFVTAQIHTKGVKLVPTNSVIFRFYIVTKILSDTEEKFSWQKLRFSIRIIIW